mmetsp:Transcript_27465/g.41586  ORF Transcript_27465/g.41586 Transcript_27465/m.41586 type:complete len:258 (+) Transcript_27465:171-944(+)
MMKNHRLKKRLSHGRTTENSAGWILRLLLVALMTNSICHAFTILPAARIVTMSPMRTIFNPTHSGVETYQKVLSTATSMSLTDSNFHNLPTPVVSIDFAAQAPDMLRTVVFGLVGIMVLVAAVSTYVTQSLIPEQMDKLSVLVAKEKPEEYEKISQQLEEGQRLKDRPDLMKQLVEAGVDLMKDEKEEEMAFLIDIIRKEKNRKVDDEESEENMENIIKSAESTLGMTIEEFVAKVDKNADSKYLTDNAKELADLLR